MNKSNKTAQTRTSPGVHAQSHMDTYLAGFIRKGGIYLYLLLLEETKKQFSTPKLQLKSAQVSQRAFAAVAGMCVCVCVAGCGRDVGPALSVRCAAAEDRLHIVS